MDDIEIDNSAPYDNVEFPVRKPGTGTWPGPSSSAGGAGVKLHGHHTMGRSAGAPKLAPLVEVDYSETGENSRLQPINFGNSTASIQSTASPQQIQIQNQNKLSSPESSAATNKIATTSLNTEGTAIRDNTIPATAPSNVLSNDKVSTSSSSSIFSNTRATTTSATAPSRQNMEKNKQPAVLNVDDSNTYISSKTTSSDSSRKKNLKRAEVEEEDFKRQDLNPAARLALERVYTQHPDFYELNSKILEEGSLLKQDVLDVYRRTGETLTYEQLLQGMLVDGERFLLSSTWLYYNHVLFLDMDGKKFLREPYGRGRIGLTSKRALFLSTETYSDANLEQFEKPSQNGKKGPGTVGYKLEVSKRSAVIFKNIPLGNFHSAELEIDTGTAVQTKITSQPNCCGCLGILPAKWKSTPPITRSINSSVLRVGVSMPPWQTRMFLDIHLDPTMSLTVARDFVSQLHAFAPHMH